MGKALLDGMRALVHPSALSQECPMSRAAVPDQRGKADVSVALLEVGDRPVEIQQRRSDRARRIILRVDPTTGRVELVLPRRTSAAEGWRFVERQRHWLSRRLSQIPAPIPFVNGAAVPVRGIPHRIAHVETTRGRVRAQDGVLFVPGEEPHISRRLTDWLRAEARRELNARVRQKAETLGRPVTRVVIKDTRTRWGSCSSRGIINLSWRLILAPDAVLDYVVAHEVGHLVEMNHGPKFWALVDQLTPHARDGRNWLRLHGSALHRYG
ncbi:MAG: SprT family zinc-dependent metalloprotease [Pseudomonadota bacterium]